MTAEIHRMPQPKLHLYCAKCGVASEPRCDCNVGYITAGEVARRAVAANPEMSDRAIAAAIGVSDTTVLRARKATGASKEAPEKRAGKDGKSYTAKPKRKKPKHPREVEDRAARLILDEGKRYDEAVAATGISVGTVHKAVAREEALREAQADPEIDVTTLSMTAQQKLAAAERQMRKRVFREAEEAARAQMVKRMEEMMMPAWRKQFDDSTQVIKARKGALSDQEYKKLLRCIHPDTRNSASQELLREVYDMISSRKLVLVAEKENPTESFKVPTTDEVMRGWR